MAVSWIGNKCTVESHGKNGDTKISGNGNYIVEGEFYENTMIYRDGKDTLTAHCETYQPLSVTGSFNTGSGLDLSVEDYTELSGAIMLMFALAFGVKIMRSVFSEGASRNN